MKSTNSTLQRRLLKTASAVSLAALMMGVCHAGTTIGINFQSSRSVAAPAFGVKVSDWTALNSATGTEFIYPPDSSGTLGVVWGSADIWHNGSLSGDAGNNDVYYEYLDDGVWSDTSGSHNGNWINIMGLSDVFSRYVIQTAGSIGDGATRLSDVTLVTDTASQSLTYPTAQNFQGSGVGLSTPSTALSSASINLYGGTNLWNGGPAGTRAGLAGIIITDQPVINYQPVKPPMILYSGQALALNGLQAIGVPPLNYQWRKDGVKITGATSASYSKSISALADSGNYDVVVANSYGSVTSSVIAITINAQTAPFNIAVAPLTQTQYVGGSAMITVTAEGTTPFTYQWKKNGATITGATSSTLTFSSLKASDAGTYTCTIGNGAGSVDSSAAALSVVVPPSGFSVAVLADLPLAYYRLNETDPLVTEVATNLGSLGAAGNGSHFPGLIHNVPGAVFGDTDTAAYYTAIDSSSDDGGVPTLVPYNAASNPSGSFTVEFWAKPAIDGNGNAQCPIVNRYDYPSGTRTGWDFWQRPSGTGWNFRMFSGYDSTKVFNITGGPYTVGAWCHVVAVYNADVPSATLYVNGVKAAESAAPAGTYGPNLQNPLSIGGFPDASGNPFIGALDEVALYSSALSSQQILAHYKNATNAQRATSYSALIVADGAVEYLRLDEPAHNAAANGGSLGPVANGVYSHTQSTNGPQSPAFAGFESDNAGISFNGQNSYVELGNPSGLNFTGPLTIEAWVQPAATQGGEAYIVAHGGNDTWSGETSLRIENSAYQIVSINSKASYAVPAEDLGTTNWVHLVGTYDGTNWNLFRNGILVASMPDKTGPSVIANANWAIGARGRWKYAWGYPDSGLERQFSGQIDEVAIYNHALTPARVLAHYNIATVGAETLKVQVVAGPPVTITWLAGTLQQSDTVNGTFTDVSDAKSPYNPPAGASQKFYRIRF